MWVVCDSAKMATPATLSRDDKRKQREIDEARKAGTLPPEMDVESGKLINPHNPEFITKRPWYLGESGPSLNHQEAADKTETLTVTQTDEIAAAARKLQRQQAAAGDSARPVVGQWVEAKYRGKAPRVPGKITKVRPDGSCDIAYESGKKEARVLRLSDAEGVFGGWTSHKDECRLFHTLMDYYVHRGAWCCSSRNQARQDDGRVYVRPPPGLRHVL